ncbi:nuclear export factor [Coccidioides immitis H538.4]|nr:nuclear export factor [Coccidioides immitis H538.4]
MGAYLMDMFVDRERLNALTYICKAYKPDLNIRFITEELGFESDEQAARFILDHVPEELLQEKPDGVKLVTAKAQPYFEAAKAEAHRIVDIKGQI